MVCYDNVMPKINLLKSQASKLRDAGYSYNMIFNRLGISKSTLSNWFRDRPFKPNKEVLKRIQYGPIKSAEKSHNKKVAEINKLRDLGTKEVGKLTRRDLWLLGIGLYLGEGTKSYDSTRVINANPDIIRLAIRWFKEVCKLTDENITIALHLYPDNDIEKCLCFWRKVTKLPRACFRKTQIDHRKDKTIFKNKKLPYGTAHITIISSGNPKYGVKLSRRIYGWMHGVLNQI